RLLTILRSWCEAEDLPWALVTGVPEALREKADRKVTGADYAQIVAHATASLETENSGISRQDDLSPPLRKRLLYPAELRERGPRN
ncbi:MAG TPA: hypothetical protein VFZ61_21335, partial [Polyangiales bacterium]